MSTFACADLGNTNLKLCLFKGAAVLKTTGFAYRKNPRAALEKAAGWLSRGGQKAVTLCSVNRSVNTLFFSVMRKKRIRVSLLQKALPAGMKSLYDLRRLGMDRLANIVAARLNYRARNLMVISCGTALTLDVIEGNTHQGGFITPGLDALLSALHDKTDLLPRIKPGKGAVALGRNTRESMIAGCGLLFSGGVRNMTVMVEKSRKRKYSLILTGGGASALAQVLPGAVVDGALTFDGIRRLAGGR